MKSAVNPFPTDHPLSRRAALGTLLGIGATAFLAACGSDSKSSTPSTSASTSAADSTTGSTTASTTGSTAASSSSTVATAAAGAATDPIPSETGGPFPGDGTNGPNVLTMDGVVRSDIRSSIGDASGTAAGVPLTINLAVTDAATGAAMQGAAVYAWHCDRDGNYSMYSQAAADENYLRGVQPADASGNVSFTSIFPAAYSGRWPHIHLEIYSSVEDATGGGQPLRTTQLALPEDTCAEVYATDGYEQSVGNLAQTSLQRDNVFGDDGGVHELATMSGTVASGLVATLAVPI